MTKSKLSRLMTSAMLTTDWPDELAKELWINCKCGARIRLIAKDFHVKRCPVK